MEVDIRSWRSFVTNVSFDSDSKTMKGIKAAFLGRYENEMSNTINDFQLLINTMDLQMIDTPKKPI